MEGPNEFVSGSDAVGEHLDDFVQRVAGAAHGGPDLGKVGCWRGHQNSVAGSEVRRRDVDEVLEEEVSEPTESGKAVRSSGRVWGVVLEHFLNPEKGWNRIAKYIRLRARACIPWREGG